MLRLLRSGSELDVSRGRGVGAHCIVDLWGASHLTDAKVLTTVLETASNAAGASLLKIFLHEFPSSGGITGVALLAESHMSSTLGQRKDMRRSTSSCAAARIRGEPWTYSFCNSSPRILS